MRLNNGTDWLELDVAHPTPSGAEQDLLLNVSFQVTSFSGADQSWVVRSAWDGFVQEFTHLEESRRGNAVLLGASPEEFQMRFHVYNSAGHPAVEGMLVRRNCHENEQFVSRIEFAMPFEADRLASMLREFRSYTREPE